MIWWFLIIFGIITLFLPNKAPNTEKPKCSLHTWVYKTQPEGEYMVCEDCGYMPGHDDGEQL